MNISGFSIGYFTVNAQKKEEVEEKEKELIQHILNLYFVITYPQTCRVSYDNENLPEEIMKKEKERNYEKS